MMILKITINKARDIESIELNINDNLISYLSNEENQTQMELEEVVLLILLLKKVDDKFR
ncbi:hypothetical protein [Clostridium botulinum]|uniref:hypothetical protein n=1 Tax=Clostridium botulinum TaxID=1491 RepID=UPI00036AE089|nr:hypothetical protein [Clostridium botulinum]